MPIKRALIVVAIKGLPGSTEVKLGWGVWAFAGSVVLSLIASMLLHRLEDISHPEPESEPQFAGSDAG